MFGGLFVDVWCGCSGCVWYDGDRFGSCFEDGWSGGAFDVMVLVAGWDSGWVDPALRFRGVELEAEFLYVCGNCVQGVFDVGMVCDDVYVIHVGSCGCVGCSAVELFVGFGKRGVEGEGKSSSGKGASHGNPTVCGVSLCVCVVEAAVVGGLGRYPWPEEWFEFWVILLDGL